jgi:hypothetical protein
MGYIIEFNLLVAMLRLFFGDGALDLGQGCNEQVIEHDLEWKALANVAMFAQIVPARTRSGNSCLCDRPRNAKMSRINSLGPEVCPNMPSLTPKPLADRWRAKLQR